DRRGPRLRAGPRRAPRGEAGRQDRARDRRRPDAPDARAGARHGDEGRARPPATEAGASNVDFRQGPLERLPVETGTADAVTSNCVINLVPDKAAVFAEIARVLKPGGRVVVSDIVLDRPLPEAVAKDVFAWCGCVAGGSGRKHYLGLVEARGRGQRGAAM